MRGVFLDISKAFDNVWHKGLIYKLQENGISGELLNILIDFQNNRRSYIEDLPEGLVTNAKLFADDTSLFRLFETSLLVSKNSTMTWEI